MISDPENLKPGNLVWYATSASIAPIAPMRMQPKPGDLVWYAPWPVYTALYRGVVDSGPRLLGGHTWVVNLRALPPEVPADAEKEAKP